MSRRKDPNKKKVKEQLFYIYGYKCMLCKRTFNRTDLTLHHLKKWEHTHNTTLEESSLICETCHKSIHVLENIDKKEYNRLNNKIRKYKKSRG